VETYLKGKKISEEAKKDINDDLNFKGVVRTLGEHTIVATEPFEWAKQAAQATELDFLQKSHRIAIGKALVHQLHGKSLVDYIYYWQNGKHLTKPMVRQQYSQLENILNGWWISDADVDKMIKIIGSISSKSERDAIASALAPLVGKMKTNRQCIRVQEALGGKLGVQRATIKGVAPDTGIEEAMASRVAKNVMTSHRGMPLDYRAQVRTVIQRSPNPQETQEPINPITPPLVSVEETEWNAKPVLQTKYTDVAKYKTVRQQVAAWGVTTPADYIEQAITEWNTKTGMHGHMGNNFDGDPHRSYLNLRRLYQASGVTDVGTYLTGMQSTSFFGLNITGVPALKTAIDTARAALTAAGKSYTFGSGSGGFVPRTFNDNINKLSDHALGTAIDLSPSTNPQLTNKKVVLVIDAVCGNVLPNGLRAAIDYDSQKSASDTFKAQFNDTWVKTQKDDLAARKLTLATTKTNMALEKKNEADAVKSIKALEIKLKKTPNDATLQSELTAAKQTRDTAKQQKDTLRTIVKAAEKQDALVKAIDGHRTKLNDLAANGFLDLDKDLVTQLRAAGLTRGGTWGGRKDYMHFELP